MYSGKGVKGRGGGEGVGGGVGVFGGGGLLGGLVRRGEIRYCTLECGCEFARTQLIECSAQLHKKLTVLVIWKVV